MMMIMMETPRDTIIRTTRSWFHETRWTWVRKISS